MNSIEPQIQTQSHYAFSQDDEIDLMELFSIVWAGKWIILSLTAISAIAAYIIISSLPLIYEVSSRINENSEYELQSIQPSGLDGGDSYQVAPIRAESLYRAVLAQADSLYVKKAFWEFNTGFTLSDDVEVSNDDENLKAFLAFSANLAIALAEKDNQNPLMATVSLETADSFHGVKQVNEYLRYVDEFVVSKSLGQLQAGLQSSLDRLENDYQNLKDRELVELEDKLIRLAEARDLANSLNIVETPYDQVENVASEVLNNRLYLLGTRTLSEEIKSLTSRKEKPLQAFVPKLRSMELWKQQIERDLRQIQNNKGKIKAFVVVTPAEASFKPTKPNKMLLFVASIFAAGFLSLILVFILHGARIYKTKKKTA